ncbi:MULTISPECIES: ATP-binding protein [Streptomyces]|uniref:ATP-binding protein n=1 Tax=Streptomyces TaxID=1883 RepID=UPI002248F7AB|nr:ATP-binding protein [Streptomyces sp. JHD 1]MCX2969397.1 ATP-binding protein [Streptomyces sp. JHD 1]
MGSAFETRTQSSVLAMPRMVGGQLDMTLDVHPQDLGAVRAIVHAHTRLWRVEDSVADRILTVVTELLTNVLQHTTPDQEGRRKADLLIQQVADGMTAIVRDQDRCPPVLAPTDPLAENGRGLVLVRALTDDMSVSITGTGKDVWVFVADPERLQPQSSPLVES